MYYSHSCSYCTKVFYTYHSNKEQAAEILFVGIKSHLTEWDEDHKEYEFDEAPEIEIDQMYEVMIELASPPSGGYELR